MLPLQTKPARFAAVLADESVLREWLARAPLRQSDAIAIDLPTPAGGLLRFRIWESPIMEDGLARRYPGLHTYTATVAGKRAISAKIDLSPGGLHGYIFDGSNSYLIDPAGAPGAYIVYYRRDYTRPDGSDKMACAVPDHRAEAPESSQPFVQGRERKNGSARKTYRLALAADSEYCAAVDGPSPTKAGVLAKMITTLNRVNGVYERELSLSMVLVANEDTLIFIQNSPYSNTSGSAMLLQNQAVINGRIGAANYDIGHVFSTAAGGIAEIGSVCADALKAGGVTGQMSPTGDAFDIDYVAHEMGHQFGADHTFNASTGSCAGNIAPMDAFEPGSGSTIMAYAGICSVNDFQPHSDDYFHSRSLEEISTFITTGNGATCPAVIPGGGNNVALPPFAAGYSIPARTPFELEAPPAAGDSVRYCWEQRDLGDIGESLSNTRVAGPLFRSFPPAGGRTRVFPAPSQLIRGITAYDAEKLPDTGRTLHFGLTARQTAGGWGNFDFPDDRVTLNVVRTGAPFAVSFPAGGDTLAGGSLYAVRWETSGTDAPPIACSQVDIYLSTDSGYTFPVVLKSATPNDGAEIVRIPNLASTSAARIKVKGRDNVFFNLNRNGPFILLHSDQVAEGITISPVPATGLVHIYIPEDLGKAGLRITDAVGRVVWSGTASGDTNIAVDYWARGIYCVVIITDSGVHNTRLMVLR